MKRRLNEIINSQKGSSLAFVLIIGMIIMIMVASLLAVANSDFTYTQEAVESRQAYIDAKSVIEFGKVEIYSRIVGLEEKDTALKALYQEKAALIENNPSANTTAIDNQIEAKITEIDNYLREVYYIGGDENDVSGTLKKISSPDDSYGSLKVAAVADDAGTKYTFIIETTQLRRKLDYETYLTYNPTTLTSTGTPTVDWIDAQIRKQYNNNGNNNPLKCYIGGVDSGTYNGVTLTVPASSETPDIRINQFEWIKDKTLELAAKNIYFITSTPANENLKDSTFNITASEGLRFAQNFPLGNQSNNGHWWWDIFNWWGNGNDSNQTINLTAKNIIFEQDLVLGDNSTMTINCNNLWIQGNIILGRGSSLKIIGTGEKAQMIAGNIISAEKNQGNQYSGSLEISNLSYFSCASMNLNKSESLTIAADKIVIDQDFTLNHVYQAQMTTKYFYCKGKTMISDSGSDYYSKAIKFTAKDNLLAVYFKNGFEVLDSYVAIETADQVIFGGTFRLHEYELSVAADHIYFDGDHIYVEDDSVYSWHGDRNHFTYAGKGGTSTNTTINVKSTIHPTYRTGNGWRFDQYEIFAIPGIYTGVKGTMPDGLKNPQKPYDGPQWTAPGDPPLPPGGGSSGGGTVIGGSISTGAETYY